MVRATLEVSGEALASLRQNPEGFAREMGLAAAANWYELQRVSQEQAAQIAGLCRHDFIPALARFVISSFQPTPEEPRAEAEGELRSVKSHQRSN